MFKILWILIFFQSLSCRSTRNLPLTESTSPKAPLFSSKKVNIREFKASFKRSYRDLKEAREKIEREKAGVIGNSSDPNLLPVFKSITNIYWKEIAHSIAEKFPPVIQVNLKGRKFYLTNIIEEENESRKKLVLYTEDEEKDLIPRFFYKSLSDGFWRVSPFISGSGHYSKGNGIHYTQETKPHPKLIQEIEKISKENNSTKTTIDIDKWFKGPLSISYYWSILANYNYKEEINVKEYTSREVLSFLSIVQSYQPGSCFDSSSKINSIEALDKLIDNINLGLEKVPGFVPDFTKQPFESFTIEHSLLGETKIEVFQGKLDSEVVHWHMARIDDHIWIDRISLPNEDISSYGTYKTLLNSGFLTNKPLEYLVQLTSIIPIKRNNISVLDPYKGIPIGTYAYITKILALLNPIKKYRDR